MGLLDDAIKDHLELKRRRGADPTEIAREEREALDPVFPDEPRPAALDGELQSPVLDPGPPHGDELAEAFEEHGDPALAMHPQAAAQESRHDDFSTIGQETAELDMEAVLEQDARLAAKAEAPPATATAAVEDDLDWEVPGEEAVADPPPEPIPGQERLSFE